MLRLWRYVITKLEKEAGTMAKDFVCGMDIDEKKAGASYSFGGKTYYFCADGCKDEFARSPEKFLESNK